MVKGLDRFREHFESYKDRYVLIGGVATWLALDEAGLAARATRDLDIVLCIEALDAEFAEHFWAFIRDGEYAIQEKSGGGRVFYRFSRPGQGDYPDMLELFSRKPDELVLGDDSHLTPIPVEDDVSSLSAILLDDDYYHWLHANVTEQGGVSVIDERCLIPLKAKAWLDLTERKAKGENVDSRNIKKHCSDVLRLFQLLTPDTRIELPASIENDLARFLDQAGPQINDGRLKSLGIRGVTADVVTDRIRDYFARTENGKG